MFFWLVNWSFVFCLFFIIPFFFISALQMFCFIKISKSHSFQVGVNFFVFFQGLTTYLLQGSYMKLKINDKFSFPAASLAIFENASLLVLIPFIDRVVYPGLRRFGFNFTPLRRIGVGLIFAAGSVALAGIIEIERKNHGRVQQNVFNTTINASTMSVFYQVPQYILQGASEALVSVTGK